MVNFMDPRDSGAHEVAKTGTRLSPKTGPFVCQHAARIEKRFGALLAGGVVDARTSFVGDFCTFCV